MSHLTINTGVTSSLCEIMRRPAFPTTRLTIGKLLDVNNNNRNNSNSIHQSLQQQQQQQQQSQSQLTSHSHSIPHSHPHQSVSQSQQQLQQLLPTANSLISVKNVNCNTHNGANSNCNSVNSSSCSSNNNQICNSESSNITNRREKRRYSCSKCPYSTDRRDLFTRHENIHRDEKPFRCYVCNKMFNRADHVKKHFLRIHKGLDYDVKLTKRIKGIDYDTNENSPSTIQVNSGNNLAAVVREQQQQQQQLIASGKEELIGTSSSIANVTGSVNGANVNVNPLFGSSNSSHHHLVSRILDQREHYLSPVVKSARDEGEGGGGGGGGCGGAKNSVVSVLPVGKGSIVHHLNDWTAAVGCILGDHCAGEAGASVQANTSTSTSTMASCASAAACDGVQGKEKDGRGLHTASELDVGRSKIRCTGAYEADSPDSSCLLSPVSSPCDSADSSSSSSPSSSCSLSPSSPSSPPSTSASSSPSTSQDLKAQAEKDKKSIIAPTTTSSLATRTAAASPVSTCNGRASTSTSSAPAVTLTPNSPTASPNAPTGSGGNTTAVTSSANTSASTTGKIAIPDLVKGSNSMAAVAAAVAAAASVTAAAATAAASSGSSNCCTSTSAATANVLGSILSRAAAASAAAVAAASTNYNSTSTLRVNLASKLNAKSNYECEECGCNFVDYASLHTHRYLLHEYICHSSNCLPYTCVVCGVKTQTQRSMIQHMTVHSYIGRKINSHSKEVKSNSLQTVSISGGKKKKRLLLDIAEMVKFKNQKMKNNTTANNTNNKTTILPVTGSSFNDDFNCVSLATSIVAANGDIDHSPVNSFINSSARRKQLIPRKILKAHIPVN